MTDPTPTRDEAVPLPDSRELPPMTERGLAGQLMDAAWPHYGGNNQPPDFWNDFGEGIRFALHYLASAPAPASGRVDAGLPGPNKQLDRVRIGEGEYVRADEAIKTVMELQRQLYDADKRLASLSPAEMPGVEEIARAMCKAQHYDPDFDYDPNGISDLPGTNVRWKLYVGQARAILALFAPVLAEKERDSLRRETRALAQAQDWRNEAAKAEARALAAEAALAAERERCAKIAEGPEYWPRPPEPGDRLTYRGTADHNWLAVKPPYRINSYSQGRADAAAAIRAQQWRRHDPCE